MPRAPVPADDASRVQALHELRVLDTPAEESFDELVRVAAQIAGTPISLVSLVDADRQWFKANVGLAGATQTPREQAFCAYAILDDDLLHVPDATADARFADNPLVLGPPGIRFYAGAPLRLASGHRVGTLCVIDQRPRTLGSIERSALVALSRVTANLLELRVASQRLARNRQLLETVGRIARVGGWELDVDAGQLHWTAETRRIHGVPADYQPTLESALEFYPPGMRQRVAEAVAHGACVGNSWDMEGPLRRADGEIIHVRTRGCVEQRDGRAVRLYGAIQDVTEEWRVAREVEHKATHDPLTDLLNREAFEAHLAKMLEEARADELRPGGGEAHRERAQGEHAGGERAGELRADGELVGAVRAGGEGADATRRHGQGHALLFIDLDRFKIVNDTCGHVAGDELLQQIADLFRASVRESDRVARLGGDEFAILLHRCAAAHAQEVAEQINQRVQRHRYVRDGQHFRIGASIGLVMVDATWPSTAALMQAADAACFAAKAGGRDRVHRYESSDESIRSRQAQTRWAVRLEEALDENRFQLHGQLITTCDAQREPFGLELLLRMEERDGELVMPGAFLPAAERYGLQCRIDRWVVDRAMALLRDGASHLPRLFINLSGQSLTDTRFHDTLLAALDRLTSAQRRRLVFEITETAVISNLREARALLDAIRPLGPQVALDDFGAGMASFGYLRDLPVDLLKVDGSFIRTLREDALSLAAVRAFVDVARTLELTVVAEHVGSPEVLAALEALGVGLVQGFFLHRPEPVADVRGRLAQWSARSGPGAGPEQTRAEQQVNATAVRRGRQHE